MIVTLERIDRYALILVKKGSLILITRAGLPTALA